MEETTEQSNLAQAAYQGVKAKICDGTYPMGEKVSEVHYAVESGISRTPIRAALSRLEAEGFLTREPNKGFRVTVFTIADVREIYGVRALLESEAVRLAGRRGLDKDTVAELTILTLEMSEIVMSEDDEIEKRKRFLPLNYEFHDLIYRSCGNKFLQRQIAATADLPLALRNYFNFSADELAESHAAHVSILTALRNSEADRAAGLMREHIWAARDRMSVKKSKSSGRKRKVATTSRGKRILTPGKYRSPSSKETL